MTVSGNDKVVFLGRVALDSTHFLSTEYKIDDTSLDNFVKSLQKSAQENSLQAKTFVTEKFTKISESLQQKLKLLQQALPDFTGVQNMYAQEFQQILEEMKRDETLRALIEFIVNSYEKAAKVFDELAKIFGEAYKKVTDIFDTFYSEVVEIFNEKVLPDLKILVNQISELLFGLYEDMVKLLTATFSRIAKALKSVEGDFNKIAKNIADIFNEISKLVNDLIQIVNQEIDEICRLIKEMVQQIPGFEMIKEQYNEMMQGWGLGESLANLLRDLISIMDDFVPSTEVKEFVAKSTDYIDKVSQWNFPRQVS